MSVILCAAASRAAAEPLAMESYLAQVRQGNPAYRAMVATEASLQVVALEPETMLSPYLSAGASYLDDQAEQPISFQPQHTIVSSWDLSVSKQFDVTGTRLSLGYKGGNMDFALPSFTTGALGDVYFAQNGVSVGLTQPLIKDFGARGHRLLRRKVDGSIGSLRMLNRHGAAAALFEAQAAYVSLASARQVAALLEESLERNQKILQWTKDKFNDDLADKVDVLQVEAALRQVQAALFNARRELKGSQEKLNTLRGEPADKEVGELEALAAPAALPAPAGERFDVKAAELSAQSNVALAEETTERYTPDLSLVAQVTGTGGDAPPPGGRGESWFPDHPTYMVGLRLTSILDLPLYHKVLQGTELAKGVGADDVASKRAKAGLEWRDLQGQWESLQEQLRLASELEAIQKEKAEREKKRYQEGRTTNFQVLRFDEDYAQARIGTLRLTAQAAVLAAQAGFYNGGGIQW